MRDPTQSQKNLPTATTPEGKVREKLSQARSKLLLMQPFLGYLVANLEDRVSDSEKLNNVATDGQIVVWQKAFIEKATIDDVMFLLAHESLHCALQHLWRRTGRTEKDWDDATDIVVNDMLVEAGLRTALPVMRGSKGRSAEEVYEDIATARKGNPQKGSCDSHGFWPDDPNPSPEQRMRADLWRAAIGQAREFGNMPAALAREVTKLLEPKRDWRDLLRQGLFFPEDYRWIPTDRRFPEVLLPTLKGETHRVVVALDTSGSIQGPILEGFWAELVAILRNNRCEARVLACDAEVQNEWDETEFNPSMISQLRGGGGTSFVPVFERVKQYAELGWRPEAIVYLTDLDGSFPTEEPEARTLWIVQPGDQNKPVPFGEVVPIE